MRFTEHEMTVGVAAAARHLFEATPRLVRKASGGAEWEELSRMVRFRHLTTAGDLVLPGLVALPERPTVGATPAFTDEEYGAAATEAARSRAEQQSPGSWDSLAPRRQRRAVEATRELLRVAVAAMPHRQDPDALIVPDHL